MFVVVLPHFVFDSCSTCREPKELVSCGKCNSINSVSNSVETLQSRWSRRLEPVNRSNVLFEGMIVGFLKGKSCWFTNKGTTRFCTCLIEGLGCESLPKRCVSMSEPPTEMLHFNGKPVDFLEPGKLWRTRPSRLFPEVSTWMFELRGVFLGLRLREWICAIVFLEDFFFFQGSWESNNANFVWVILRDFPLQKKCSVWVGNSSSTLVLESSQILRFLSAWTLSNATIVVCLRGCPVIGFCFPGRRMEPVEIFWNIVWNLNWKIQNQSNLKNLTSIRF